MLCSFSKEHLSFTLLLCLFFFFFFLAVLLIQDMSYICILKTLRFYLEINRICQFLPDQNSAKTYVNIF